MQLGTEKLKPDKNQITALKPDKTAPCQEKYEVFIGNLIFHTWFGSGILRKALYGWGRIFVVTGDPAAYQVRADARQHSNALFSHILSHLHIFFVTF